MFEAFTAYYPIEGLIQKRQILCVCNEESWWIEECAGKVTSQLYSGLRKIDCRNRHLRKGVSQVNGKFTTPTPDFEQFTLRKLPHLRNR